MDKNIFKNVNVLQHNNLCLLAVKRITLYNIYAILHKTTHALWLFNYNYRNDDDVRIIVITANF